MEHAEDNTNIAMLMGDVARKLLGEPTSKRHGGLELRYGTRGSLSIDLHKGAYFDHEAAQGGGVLDLIIREIGGDHRDAVTWLKDNHMIVTPCSKDNGQTKQASDARHGHDRTDAKPNGNAGAEHRIVETYDYVDENGKLLFQVVRYDPKDFRQRRPDGSGGWSWTAKGVRQVPYRLPELREALAHGHTIVIVEGEKDVDALRAWGIPATCNAGGAGKWSDALNEFFRDADIVIIPDNDPPARKPDGTLRLNSYGKSVFPGQDHARAIARSLCTIPRNVRILELPGLPAKGDFSDWVAAGGTPDEFWRLVATAAVPREQYQGPSAEGVSASDEAPPPAPLIVKASAEWEGKAVKSLRWTVRERILKGNVAILSGDGAIGKTTIALQLAVGVSRGTDWLGAVVEEGGPVLFFSAEEDEDEVHRRLAMIIKYQGVKFSDLGNLYVHCRPGENALLGAPDKGVIKGTPLLAQLTAAACDRGAALVIIEAVADVFGGDEIDRGHASQFMTLMRQLAIKSKASVLLLQHPSQAGMSSGTGTSGSSHWNNAARSRLYFSSVKDGDEPDSGLRELRVMKSNYGPAAESVRVRWQRGVFVLVGSRSVVERAAAEAPADDAFMRCLDEITVQKRSASPNKSPSYAPAIFEKMPEAAGFTRAALALAMERLYSAKKITSKEIGPPSARRLQVVRKEPDAEK
jgi:RecA-family ATPase